MREIKFRAWSKNEKRFHYFTLANILQNEIEFQRHIINGTVFEQFTGLHDKNGKEIYEGDICSGYYCNFIVEWDKENSGFDPFTVPGYGGHEWDHEEASGCEIIGNIHENSELMK